MESKNTKREGKGMKLNITGLSPVQQSACAELSRLLHIELEPSGVNVQISKSDDTGSGISVTYDGTSARITYEAKHQWARALGLLVEHLESQPEAPLNVREEPAYDRLSVMVDCSRNAVMHMDGFQRLVRHIALMGYSEIQLYMEDTYELPDYPYFGYMRGRYSGEELQAMDHYAAQFGIEVVPCIQTLAHLNQALQWPAFRHVHDVDDILLAEEEATYELIDAMFRTLRTHLRSRTIHIGMDEAHLIGLGQYLEKHGFVNREQILMRHFERVMELARKYDYEPMMWSDMFFRLATGGEYYEPNAPISEDVIKHIPDDITLVYWDYYSTSRHTYDHMLLKHKQMSERIAFAGGAWKWTGFTPNNQFSKKASQLAHQSCLAAGIKDVLVTAWGDNGAEASMFSVLPTLQLWAELCYANRADEAHLSQRFRTCVNASYADFMKLDLPLQVPDNTAEDNHSVNPSKYLLYQDVLCGLFDQHVVPGAYADHYQKAAQQLAECGARNSEWEQLFAVQAALCSILELKCEAGLHIRRAYRDDDRAALHEMVKQTLPEIVRRTEQFAASYRSQWHAENKIFGLEVFDIRIGGLLQRLNMAIARLEGYLAGHEDKLEELEQDVLRYDCLSEQEAGGRRAISANVWHKIATASVMAWRM